MDENLDKIMPEEPKTATPDSTSSAGRNKPSFSLFIFGSLGTVALVLIVGFLLLSRQVSAASLNPAVLTGAKLFHLSAANINGESVSYFDYATDLQTLTRFYDQNKEASAGLTSEQISDQVLSRLFINKVIESLAKRYDVSVSDEELNAEKQVLLSKFPDEASAEADLKKQYNWDLNTYLDRIVKPYLLEQQVVNAFQSSADEFGKPYEETQLKARHILLPVEDEKKDAQVKKQAEAILARIKAGEDFEALAKKYTVETEREKGGELDWFGPDIMVKEFQEAVSALQVGEVSNPVKTNYGYHIIKLEGKRDARNFGLLMNDLISKAKVRMKIGVHNPFETVSASGAPTLQ